MYGPMLCYASDCTEGVTVGDIASLIFIAGGIVLLIVAIDVWRSRKK